MRSSFVERRIEEKRTLCNLWIHAQEIYVHGTGVTTVVNYRVTKSIYSLEMNVKKIRSKKDFLSSMIAVNHRTSKPSTDNTRRRKTPVPRGRSGEFYCHNTDITRVTLRIWPQVRDVGYGDSCRFAALITELRVIPSTLPHRNIIRVPLRPFIKGPNSGPLRSRF